jgi:hypothetical protein
MRGVFIPLAAVAAIVVSAGLSITPSSVAAATVQWRTPTQIAAPNGGQFTGVSCTDPTDCTAVGVTNETSTSGPTPIAVTETNGVWGNALVFPSGGSLTESDLNSVSCNAPGDCTAVGKSGEDHGAGAHVPTYATETNGVWGPVTTFPGTVGDGSSMDSVSCPAVGYCVAVGTIGYVEETGPSNAAAAIETDGVWGPDTVLAPPPNATAPNMTSVSCPTINLCYALGTDSGGTPFVVEESSGVWGQAQSVATSSNLVAIDCPTADSCTAVGNNNYSTLSDGAWSANGLPGIDMTAVSCVDVSDCSAVGSSGHVTETDGVWDSPTTIGGFPVGTEYLSSISCTSTTACTAVGYDGDTDGNNSQPFYVISAASSPAPTPTPPAPAPTPTPPPVITSPTTNSHGYWLVGSDGGIFSFGSAQFYGSTGSLKLQRPVVGITPTANDEGYWLVASDGGIFSFGNAAYYGSIPGLGIAPAGSSSPNRLNAPIVAMVPSTDGGGYFMVGSDGGVFTFGDAKFEGSCPGIGGCSGAAVAVMPDASGNGYWLVTATGNVYAFGDAAATYGAPGPQSVPVTSAVRTPNGDGYWILFSNGQVGAYGDAATFGGPLGSVDASDPAMTIFTTSDGSGYWVASANGSVYAYGDAHNDGGTSGVQLNGPIIAATGW